MTITGINGSVSVVEGLKNLFKEITKVSFTAPLILHKNRFPIVQDILVGRLGVTQGYLNI